MSQAQEFFIKFWGVRGSIPCPGPRTVRYGGNTSCFEIRCGGHLIIIDGGTGLRGLGSQIAKERPERVDLFFTHTHYDHVAGVPFFQPAYLPDIEVNFWAGHLPPGRSIRTVLCEVMMAPLFPVPLAVFSACEYHDFQCGVPLEPAPGVRLSTVALNHPNNACGYRVDFDGRSICIITDTEHQMGVRDEAIVEFVRGADIMVYDSMFTDEEFPRFVTWGHSTWQEALRVAEAAGVRRTVLFHHDPNHDDDFLDRIVAAADAIRPGTIAAMEGLVLHP